MKKIYFLLLLVSISFLASAQMSPYCNTEVFHLGDTTQTASSVFLTVEHDTGNTMKVTIESANMDPVDDLIIPGFAAGFDTISPGKYSKTLIFTSPPASVSLQILWSKVSMGGNWQLSPNNISIPFTANCSGTPAPTAQTSKYCNTQVFNFGDTTQVSSSILLSVGNIDPNSMKVIISSANSDAVDDLIIAGGSGATISGIDNSVPGELSRTLSWASAPVNADFNVIWSKVSTTSNWQLVPGSGSDTLAFIDTCSLVVPPPTVDITFMVNTASITVDPTGIFLAGGASFGVPGDNPLTDANNDGIWEITVVRNEGFSGNYIFTNGSTTSWAAKENLAGLPCGDPNSFNDRTLPAIMSDTTLLFCYETCATDTVCPAGPSTVDITLSVDLSQYTGSFTTAYVNGSFNGWNGTTNPLTDQGGGIWQGTITLPANDSIEYKFTLDGWNAQEMFAGGEPCTKTVGPNTNRLLVFGGNNVNVPTVCWESCAACVGTPPPTATSPYCNTQVFHFGNPAEVLSEANLTVSNLDPTTMKFTISSANADPIDDLIVAGGSGGAISAIDTTVPGEYSRNLSWTTPPTEVIFNVLWSKASSPGNWQLIPAAGNDTLPFLASCSTTPPPPPVKAQIDLPITWDDSANVDYTVADFDGTASMLSADPTNATNTVLMTTKSLSGQPWQGTTLSTASGLANPIPFGQGSNTLRAHIYSPDSGITVKLKVEDNTAAPNTQFMEVDMTTTSANAWEVIDFDFNNPIASNNTPTGVSYTKTVIFYDFGNQNAKTYYLDSLQFVASSVPPPPAKAQIDLPITWDDTANVNYSVTDYNGNFSMWVVDPMNPSNYVLSTTKTSASQPWAGTSLGTPSGFANPIPFGSGNTTMSAVIWSPDAGIQVRLKAENSIVGSISVETEATTQVAGGWDTLYFDFNNNVFQTPALDTNQSYELLTVFYDFNVAAATPAKTYYIDDVFMGGPTVAPPTIYNVTFQVDLSDYTGSAYSSVGVFGTFNNWCGTCNAMTDANNDSIYEVTIQTINDSLEYKFVLDGGTIDESLTAGSTCTKTTSGFTNRFIVLTGDTTTPAVCWQSCSVCSGSPVGPSTKNITFQVDMNDYTGSFTTVHLNGTFNGWCGTCNPMTDANSDGVWELTLPLAIDSIEYKFTVDGWTDDEKFAGGEPCTKTVGGFTNRFLIASGDITLPVVCWASCAACTGTQTGTDITFKVDMNDYTSPFDTAYVNGDFNGWCGKCNPMTDVNNDGVWELTINLPQDSLEFKYTVDGWDDDEKFLGGESCTKTTGGFTNRILRLNGDTTLPELCWGSCAACTGTPTVAQIRFAVDLSQYPDTFTNAYVNGEFNGWCGKCNPLSDADGDSIWDVTITLPIGDTVQFKYTLNGWQTEESLDPSLSCTETVGSFTNRVLAIVADTNMGDVCWESCWECESVGLTEGNQPNYFVVSPNPSNGNFYLDFGIPKTDNVEVSLLNITGQVLKTWRYHTNQVNQAIDFNESTNGIYFLKVNTSNYVGMKKVIISK